ARAPAQRGGTPRRAHTVVLTRGGTLCLEERMNDLPTACDTGAKRNAKGHPMSWHSPQLPI
ncbi:MAG: hypothetical protein OXC62_11760, partial [Aestuariivita sp.]|nr:hypothetical protein [Aestuariivita sp.]